VEERKEERENQLASRSRQEKRGKVLETSGPFQEAKKGKFHEKRNKHKVLKSKKRKKESVVLQQKKASGLRTPRRGGGEQGREFLSSETVSWAEEKPFLFFKKE